MSLDFDKIRQQVFNDFLGFIENDGSVKIIQKENANFLLKNRYDEIWEVDTGLYDDENNKWLVEEIKIYIAFDNEFPFSLPEIYFDENDFPKIGFIPHITYATCNICVSDEFVIVDNKRPAEIILFQYNKAKQTLIEGLKGKNEKDFEDEYLAYWETPQDKFDKIDFRRYFTLIKREPENWEDLSLLFYRTKRDTENKFKAIIYNNKETLISDYKEYFERNKYDIVENNCFYIGEIEGMQKPPFNKSCLQSLGLMPENLKPQLKRYINRTTPYKIIIFKKYVDGKDYYLGWKYPDVETKINGFRGNKVSFYDAIFKKTLPSHKKSISRFSTSELNIERLIQRTTSDNIEIPKYNFLIAGLGSVGSLLAQKLNNINFPNLTLIDDDNLSEENIGRHLLGFTNIEKNKATAVREFLLSKLPSQKIDSIQNSVINQFQNNNTLFNNQDYIFLCIGKQNLEKWFIEKLINKELSKPIFIIWVEPYLLGGQCLFLHPSNSINIDDLYFDIFKFRHSIINPDEFEKKRSLFTLKEKGCQTTYSPYSSTHLSLFISSIYPKIFEIIEQTDNDNKIISWIGDVEIAQKLNIELTKPKDYKYKIVEKRI